MIFGTLGPNELSVIERCPYYRGVRNERLDCICVEVETGEPRQKRHELKGKTSNRSG